MWRNMGVSHVSPSTRRMAQRLRQRRSTPREAATLDRLALHAPLKLDAVLRPSSQATRKVIARLAAGYMSPEELETRFKCVLLDFCRVHTAVSAGPVS